MITVTDTQLSPDRKRALVFISVLPETMEARALEFVERQRNEIKDYIRSHSRMRAAPHLEFVIDTGEKNRQRIDQLLHEDQRKQI